MAHHKSALKRIRQSKKKNIYNRQNKKVLKETVKAVHSATNYEEAVEKLKSASKVLDKMAAHKIVKKNTVAHRKSSLAKLVNSKKVRQK
jgi:small subunit ribosomal protein S20